MAMSRRSRAMRIALKMARESTADLPESLKSVETRLQTLMRELEAKGAEQRRPERLKVEEFIGSEPTPTSEIKAGTTGWESITNGVLTRADVSARTNRQLETQWEKFIAGGPGAKRARRYLLANLDRHGVDRIDIDFTALRAAYKGGKR